MRNSGLGRTWVVPWIETERRAARSHPGPGRLERLENGNTLINWGTLGQVDEVTSASERVWRLHVEIGHDFGHTTWRGVLYDPFSAAFEPVAR